MLLKLLLATCLAGLAPAYAAKTAWQWTDSQGQTHFGDRPPGSGESRAILLPREPRHANTAYGLRPAERDRLERMNQRQQQQQRRARAAGKQADREREARQARCNDHREKLHTARGRDAFKEHARYMRSNCW